MRRVYKYNIALSEYSTVSMPIDAKILSAGVQGNNIVVWALVNSDPAAKQEQRSFGVFGTGHNLPQGTGHFVATVQYPGGLWFHVFEGL